MRIPEQKIKQALQITEKHRHYDSVIVYSFLMENTSFR